MQVDFRVYAIVSRKPSNPHILRTVRQELRNHPYGELLTQKQLAKRVGVSVETIKKIESGKLKISKPLAKRLAIATGVDPRALINNTEPEKMPALAYRGEIARLLLKAKTDRLRGLAPSEELIRALYGEQGTNRQNASASISFTRFR